MPAFFLSDKEEMKKNNLYNPNPILSIHANADRAMQMSKYMRDQFAFYGIAKPELNVLANPMMKEMMQTIKDLAAAKENVNEHIKKLVTQWWNYPQRECQYIIMQLLEKTVKYWDKNIFDLLEWITLNKSWWDTVDFIASNLFGKYFQLFPDEIPGAIKRWNAQDNFWLHRVSLIFQLKYGKKVDHVLLFSQCKLYAEEKEFFIRKAIGWALRQYSKSEPGKVKAFIKSTTLSPLSVKEGSKYI